MASYLSKAEAKKLGLPARRVRRDEPRSPLMNKLSMPRSDPKGTEDPEGVTLYLPVLSMSGNRWIRLHGILRAKADNTLGWFFVAAEGSVKHRKRRARARVLFTRISTRALQDVTNLVTGLKPFEDWLVKTGWLVDDSPAWLDWQAPQQFRPTGKLRPGTYIRIEYLEEEKHEPK